MSSNLSERLTLARLRELASLLLRVEFPAPTRRIVEPLLELLVGGGTFDLKQNFLIREPAAVLLILELLPNLSEDIQLELWSSLGAILHQCQCNTSVCHQLGLSDKCLEYLAKSKNQRVAGYIISVLEILACYGISVKQLKSILSYLYTSQDDEYWAPHSVLLIGVLNNITVGVQPDIFFNFSGGHGAVLTLPPMSKFPGQPGFTISTWICCEKPYDAQREYFKPVIYWLRTGRGLGYSAHFIGSTLVLETVGKNVKKPQTHAVDYIFHSYQWHMVTVVYYHHRIRSSEVYCYVDGTLALSAEVTLPPHDERYDKCFFGGSPVATPDSVFQGQMAALYIWREPLGKNIISVLHKLGPKYQSQFKFEAEVDIPLTPSEQKMLFDGSLASSLIISYNAKAVDGQLCLEASPAENESYFAHSPHATMLEGVDPIVTTSIHSALHSLGGIQALFPLFSQLDIPQFISKDVISIDYTLSVKLLSLVFELARNSITYMFQLVQMRALELISYLLEKVSPLHLTEDLLSAIFDFMRYLSMSSFGEELLQQLVEQLLFNARLWIKASKKVQIFLYSQLATEFCMQKLGTTSLDLREVIGVSQLMFILKEHYSLSAGQTYHHDIRPYLILMVKQFVTRGKGIQPMELVSILNYLLSVPEEGNLSDVLILLLSLVFEDTNINLIRLLKNSGGLKVTARLLACASEELRINSLKLLTKVLHHSTAKEQQILIESDGILAVIKEKLLSSGQPVSVPMFNTLFQLMLDKPSRRLIESHYITLEPDHQIIFPGVVSVMISLITTLNISEEKKREEREDTSDTIMEQQSMRLQLLTYVASLSSQSHNNCLSLLGVPEWQHYMLVLVDSGSDEETDSLQTVLYQLFHTVLMYAITKEEEGWRLWVHTAAAIHAHRVKKGLLQPRSSLPPLAIKSNDALRDEDSSTSLTGESDLDGNVDSSLTPQTIRATSSKLRSLSQSRSLSEDDTGMESLSEVSLTSSETHSTPTSSNISPLIESTMQSDVPIVKTTTATKTSQTGKFPKFDWSLEHRTLFKQVLTSIQDIINKWKRETETTEGHFNISDYLADRTNLHFVFNSVQLLVLAVDSFIIMTGGIKTLMSECCGMIGKTKKKRRFEKDTFHSVASIESLSKQCLNVMEDLVLSGGLKFSMVEGRMNMEPGGVLKQCLRLILVVTSLDCIQANTDFEDQHTWYHRHKQTIEQLRHQSKSLLKIVGINDSSLDKYISESLQRKLESLKNCQLLLSKENIALLHKVIPKESENKSLIQAQVSNVLYYLSVLCVARYKNILDSVDKERGELSTTRTPHSRTDSERTGSFSETHSPQLSLSDIGGRMLTEGEHLEIPETSDLPQSPCDKGEGGLSPLPSYLFRSDSHDDSASSIGSASDLREFTEKSVTFLGTEGVLHPPTIMPLTHAVDVSEQVSVSLRLAGTCLCQLLVECKSVLAKVLTGVDGRQLLSDTALKLAENSSIVEITMLLCSQEWQMSLQKTAGNYFTSLLSDGRHVSRFSESYIRGISAKNSQKVKQLQENQAHKFSIFEEQLSLFLSEAIKASHEDRKMKRAEVMRRARDAEKLWTKLSPMVDNCGSFDFTPLKPTLLWRLDLKEDDWRRRLKMLPNPAGSSHSDAVRMIPEEYTASKDSTFNSELLFSPIPGEKKVLEGEEGEDDNETSMLLDISLYDNKEVPQVTLQCGLVSLAYLLPGTLSFTHNFFTFIADDSSPEFNKVAQLGDSCTLSDQWNLADVTAVLSRHYLHQFRALEIFLNNKSSIFVVLETTRDMKMVVNLLPKVGVGAHYGLPQTRSVSLSLPRQLLKRSDMTERWVRREINNFEYLMFLNTIAGRSFNNLSQYPVFPWIIKDYTSKTIDLKDPSTYRDLSKPIGTLNPNRLAQYEERYELWESDTIPLFHYGTHYSTMAFVVHWLVRVEPFTSLHVELHDGFFDHGSRLFSSIARAWNNCQLDSSDVKELIPELFFLPEMFQNDNKFLLGYDEHDEMGVELPEGETRVVNEVMLPPWAENAHDFIRIHNQALESEYVSSNLHLWIDLIFGHKQSGPAAVEARNVFYYITYPGSVNWQAITDHNQLKAVEQQVLQFGQTPHQLLKEPHPQRQPAIKEFPPQPTSSLNPAIVLDVDVTFDVPIGLVQLSLSGSSLLAVSYNQLFAVYKWNYVPGTSSQPPLVNMELDPSNDGSLKVRLGDPLDQSISTSSLCFAATPTADIIFMCGFWDSSFKTFSSETGVSLQSVFGHRGIVTCIDFSLDKGLGSFPGDGLVATGSHDVTVLLWKWSGRLNRVVSQLQTPQGSVTPLAILNGHEKSVTCVAVSTSHGLVVSGAKNGCCLLHSTTGELLHKLVPTNAWNHPHMITLCPQGLYVIHYADKKGCLAVFTCNGKQLCYKSLDEPALAMTISSDGQYIITGGFSAKIYVLDTYTLTVIYIYEPCETSIRTLHMSHDHRFIFAGLSSGKISVLTTHFWRQ